MLTDAEMLTEVSGKEFGSALLGAHGVHCLYSGLAAKPTLNAVWLFTSFFVKAKILFRFFCVFFCLFFVLFCFFFG